MEAVDPEDRMLEAMADPIGRQPGRHFGDPSHPQGAKQRVLELRRGADIRDAAKRSDSATRAVMAAVRRWQVSPERRLPKETNGKT